MDDVSRHAGIANYGWPECEQNHDAYGSGANCADTVAPIVEFPAYATHIGATFYPVNQTGAYAFPKRYRGALFVASHGSWHKKPGGALAAQPEVAYVAMHGDTPATPVNWNDPSVQLKVFVGGFQSGGTARSARPTGIAVGVRGSLFVADDQNGLVYRIRPVSQPAVSPRR
jgi:glucose/arabinose dehydrogenase